MIKAQNCLLRVKRIRQSRNGAFCIADLMTDFGEFKVKDPILDQFDEGEYQGTVWISEIYLAQYVAYGKGVTEIRARIHDLQIDAENKRSVPREPIEPDPMDEPDHTRVKAQPAPPPAPAAAPGANPGEKDRRFDKFKTKDAAKPKPEAPKRQGEDLSEVFDLSILDKLNQREPLKLDATVDRALLRKQAAILGAQGYAFNATEQTWFPKP